MLINALEIELQWKFRCTLISSPDPSASGLSDGYGTLRLIRYTDYVDLLKQIEVKDLNKDCGGAPEPKAEALRAPSAGTQAV